MENSDKILDFPSLVPDGIYRLSNASRTSPNLYLEWESDSQINSEELDKGNGKQQWKITVTADDSDIYSIVNVHSQSSLCVIEYKDGTEIKYKLGAGRAQHWTGEPRGSQWIIGVVENANCIDLATNNVPIIWQRNNLVNQRWILEIVDNDPESKAIPPGVYNITNVARKADLLPWTNRELPQCTPVTWPTAMQHEDRRWRVMPSQGGVEITFGYIPVNSLRWLGEGPELSQKHNICRLISVPGTDHFHIALGPKVKADGKSRYLADLNPGTKVLPASSVPFDALDQRQHWYFTPYRPKNWPVV